MRYSPSVTTVVGYLRSVELSEYEAGSTTRILRVSFSMLDAILKAMALPPRDAEML
jgi:hypothetical protein